MQIKVKSILAFSCFVLGLVCLSYSSPICVESAEICDNAIDDDMDGLIDLNDVEDCTCNGEESTEELKTIPNPSFEDYSICPQGLGNFIGLDDWIYVTQTTPDYYNSCKFLGNPGLGLPPLPPPDGDGFVAYGNGNRDEVYKEYFGVCLSRPLVLDSSYRLKFDFGFGPGARGSSSKSPATVALYGTPDCIDQFARTSDCLEGVDNWVLLDSSIVIGQEGWFEDSFDFIAPDNISTIAMGPGCVYIPIVYYYWVDNLRLEKVNPAVVGCDVSFEFLQECDNLSLIAGELQDNCTYQWYKDGVALVGETNRIYQVTDKEFARYQLVVYSSGACKTIDSFFYDPEKYSLETALDTIICSGQVISSGDNVYTETGDYISIIKTEDGCDSTVSISLIVMDTSYQQINESICLNDSFELNGVFLTEPGIYKERMMGSNGCDSVVLLQLDVVDIISEDISVAICSDDNYIVGDEVFTQTGQYEIYLKSENGCDSIVILDLLVVDAEPQLRTSNENPRLGDTITLSIVLNDFINSMEIAWNNPNISCDSCFSVKVKPREGLNTYSATVVDSIGCIYELSQQIEVNPNVFIPNAFTPNGDGRNDRFVVYSDDTVQNIEYMRIYNRWGTLVYNRVSFLPNAESDGWDGRLLGAPQDPGVYVYVIGYVDRAGVNQVVSGDVTLIR